MSQANINRKPSSTWGTAWPLIAGIAAVALAVVVIVRDPWKRELPAEPEPPAPRAPAELPAKSGTPANPPNPEVPTTAGLRFAFEIWRDKPLKPFANMLVPFYLGEEARVRAEIPSNHHAVL